ncbi:hypothetical protein R1flu_009618 [Riccia fluitans]|uniref:Uncharacterized protein n=1 Tax=Riccia fluitans TaxID=41844 RepID=A0ABD1Z306_9MARC
MTSGRWISAFFSTIGSILTIGSAIQAGKSEGLLRDGAEASILDLSLDLPLTGSATDGYETISDLSFDLTAIGEIGASWELLARLDEFPLTSL